MESAYKAFLPVYHFKVNLGCCSSCPKKLSKKFQKLAGVDEFTIDKEEGIVMVKGLIKMDDILKIFRKLSKKAEILPCHGRELKSEHKPEAATANCCGLTNDNPGLKACEPTPVDPRFMYSTNSANRHSTGHHYMNGHYLPNGGCYRTEDYYPVVWDPIAGNYLKMPFFGSSSTPSNVDDSRW